MRLPAHEILHLTHVAFRDARAVQFDRDLRALHRHLHQIPLAELAIVASMCRHHAVDRAVCLALIDLGVLAGVVVENLNLAHGFAGRLPLAGIADGQPIVSARLKLVLHAGREVVVLAFRKEIATLARLVHKRAILHFVAVLAACPTGEVLAIEQINEARCVALAQKLVGLVRRDFADEHVAPANLAAVRLQLNRAGFP